MSKVFKVSWTECHRVYVMAENEEDADSKVQQLNPSETYHCMDDFTVKEVKEKEAALEPIYFKK